VTIVLHHYPASLFSEKIRALLGFYQLPWQSVIISNVMPRPLLMPLSGGYRKTPVLQIDANVYCDSRIIARALARHTGNWSLYETGFAAARLADWADTELFAITVAMNFRPEAMAAMMGQLSATDIAAFQADRAKLADGGSIVSMSPAVAAGKLQEILADLNDSLAPQPFISGEQPTIADFAVYHCLWFLNNNPVNASLLKPNKSITSWMDRMAAFGHGQPSDSDAQQALALGREHEPVLPETGANLPLDKIAIGDRVSVTPADYGRIPVTGELMAASAHEIVILRDDPQAGRIMNHFPRAGFEVTAADG
jgi:glutathione S-transferase